MRGKVFRAAPADGLKRITPAYAGKSLGVGVLWIHDKDHPRLCGEKLYQDYTTLISMGSPPPMRGKVEKRDSINFGIRITPAYAGKSIVV